MSQIDLAIEKLASVCNVSIDFIQAHAMEYIMRYGKYCVMQSIFTPAALSAMIIGIITFIVVALFGVMEEDTADIKLSIKTGLITALVTFIFVGVIGFITQGIPYLVSPKMYSVTAVLNLLS